MDINIDNSYASFKVTPEEVNKNAKEISKHLNEDLKNGLTLDQLLTRTSNYVCTGKWE